jgi:manganese transport protein
MTLSATRGSFRAVRAAALGPAFIAGIAYVDPGNFATNTSAGARYGYLLLWVIVAANLLAVLTQYLAVKLGIGTGESLAANCRQRYRPWVSNGLWLQSQLVSIATDVAELLGGAVALNLLFGLPLFPGVLLTGMVSMLVLLPQGSARDKFFEVSVLLLFAVIAGCLWLVLAMVGVDAPGIGSGLVPRLEGSETLLLASAMLGATVMPHAIYLHSALAGPRLAGLAVDDESKATATRMSLVDVVCAMALAGSVNIAMLLFAAEALSGSGTSTLEGIYDELGSAVSPSAAALFAVALLASGIASTAVATLAGSIIMQGFSGRWHSLLVRRLVTLVPAVAILSLGVSPTSALILSQAVLSLGIPFALFPLVRLTSDRALMGALTNGRFVRWAGMGIALLVSLLNMVLIGILALG